MKPIQRAISLLAAFAALVLGAERASAAGPIQYSSRSFTVPQNGTVTITGIGAMDMSDMGDVINGLQVPYQIVNTSTSTIVWDGEVTVASSGAPTGSSGMSYSVLSGGQGAGGWSWGFTVSTTLATGSYAFQYVRPSYAYGGAGSDVGAVFVFTSISNITTPSNPITAVSFSASPLSFVYNGSAQGPGITPSVGGATYSTGGTASATNAGSYTVTETATGNYSGNGSQAWTITPAGQTVSVSPSSPSVTAGGSVTFTASGGQNGYNWGGSASGSGTSQTVSFPSVGTYTVTVSSPAGGNYSASNTASATITVNAVAVSFSASPLSFTFNGSAQGPGITPSVGGATYSIGGTASATNAGSYTVTETATGSYTGSGSQTWNIYQIGQTVSVSPPSPSVTAGGSVTFTASGGNNGYTWGGSAGGNGTTTSVTFPTAGTFSVTVYSPAGGNYAQSNTATATITVNALTPQNVSLNPPSANIVAGGSVTFTASGGSNAYVWGGSASGAGATQTVTFPTAGTFSVTVYNAAGGGYAQSNTATAVVNVQPQQPQMITLNPPNANIYAGQSVTFTASGGNNTYVWGGSASGAGTTQTVTFPTAGTFTVTVYNAAGGQYAQSNTAMPAAPGMTNSSHV